MHRGFDSLYLAPERRSTGDGRPSDAALATSIGGGDYAVVYQPWLSLRSGTAVAAEALVRSPLEPDAATLFRRARRSGLAEAQSSAVQSRAIEEAARWRGPLGTLSLSLNVLPAEIARAGYDQWLLDELERLRFDPERLVIEITENALLVCDSAVSRRFERLRDAGVRIALDDFGSGYASLSYLARLPLDIIKFDRALVSGLVAGRRDRIVMRAMLDLARELGLTTVVEGVEDEAQLSLLACWGCDIYQGFLGSAPLDGDALGRFVGDRVAA